MHELLQLYYIVGLCLGMNHVILILLELSVWLLLLFQFIFKYYYCHENINMLIHQYAVTLFVNCVKI